jgi:PilZ domain
LPEALNRGSLTQPAVDEYGASSKAIRSSLVESELLNPRDKMPMDSTMDNRRRVQRFNLRLGLRYRLSEKGVEHRWSTGTTKDLSREGLGIKPRRALPVGSHIEIRIDWPARYESVRPVELQITGFVIRSENGRAAVRISSHRFIVHDGEPLSKTA